MRSNWRSETTDGFGRSSMTLESGWRLASQSLANSVIVVALSEALSVNEEYQSTNEELLASKEELQSLNEELNALNSQLQESQARTSRRISGLASAP
jgi:hypothetical protein